MKIGFALIAEVPFLKEIVRTENQIHNECQFCNRLGMDENLPHITLFQGEMDDTIDYIQIANNIAAYLPQVMPKKELKFTSIAYEPDGWYFLMCEHSAGLMALHDYTLGLVKPYIILDPKRIETSPRSISEMQKKALEAYGYRYAREAFLPHITIGRAKKVQAGTLCMVQSAFQPLFRKTKIDRITVYKMGNNGIHEKTLYQIFPAANVTNI